MSACVAVGEAVDGPGKRSYSILGATFDKLRPTRMSDAIFSDFLLFRFLGKFFRGPHQISCQEQARYADSFGFALPIQYRADAEESEVFTHRLGGALDRGRK